MRWRTANCHLRKIPPIGLLVLVLVHQIDFSSGDLTELSCVNGEVKFNHIDAIIASGRNLSGSFLKCGDYSSVCLEDEAIVECKLNMPLECSADPPVKGYDMGNLGGIDCPIDKYGCVPVGVCKLHYILIRKIQKPYNHVLAFVFLMTVVFIMLIPVYCVNFCTPYGNANRVKARHQRNRETPAPELNREHLLHVAA